MLFISARLVRTIRVILIEIVLSTIDSFLSCKVLSYKWQVHLGDLPHNRTHHLDHTHSGHLDASGTGNLPRPCCRMARLLPRSVFSPIHASAIHPYKMLKIDWDDDSKRKDFCILSSFFLKLAFLIIELLSWNSVVSWNRFLWMEE